MILDTRERHTWQDPDVPEYFNGTTLLLDRHLPELSEKRAIIYDNVEFTYFELMQLVCKTAHGLRDIGLHSDERLLMFANDSIEFVGAWLGAIRCGIVPVTVPDLHKAPLLEYFLHHTAAKALYIDAEHLDKLSGIADRLPAALEHVIIHSSLTPRHSDALPARLNVRDYAELVQRKSGSFAPKPRHKHDMSYFFYSGGTTGKPKGIVHTSVDFYLIPERFGHFLDYEPNEIVHATSKKYFTHGLWPGVLLPLYWGSTAVLTREKPTSDSLLSLVKKYEVTRLVTVPAIIRELVATAKENSEAHRRMSSVTVLCCASEKLPAPLYDDFFNLFGIEIFDAIGTAEVTYQWIANRPADYRRGSLGKPVFGYEIKLIDEDGVEVVAPNTQGEAWVKSETGLLFYWRDFHRTREATNGLWFRTSDQLLFDEDGYYWYIGRGDDLFKVSGLWVSPLEVESEIVKLFSIAECAVVSGRDEQGAPCVKAFVVLQKSGASENQVAEQIENAVRKIGGYKVPKQIEFIDELPRTELRKINRHALRKK